MQQRISEFEKVLSEAFSGSEAQNLDMYYLIDALYFRECVVRE